MAITIKEAHKQALKAAKEAADSTYDGAYCGFAWVEAKGDMRTTIAKELKNLGYQLSSTRGKMLLWNPSGAPTQSMDVKEAGAQAYLDKFNELIGRELRVKGFTFRMDSRPD